MGVERTRVAHVVWLLAPFRQLQLYYVAIPSVEHQAHVAIRTAKENDSLWLVQYSRPSAKKQNSDSTRVLYVRENFICDTLIKILCNFLTSEKVTISKF